MNTLDRLRFLFAGVVVLSLSCPAGAAGVAEGELPAAVAPALVRIEVQVQAADGEEPQGAGWSKRCPKCGNYHDNGLDEAMQDDRPATLAGFLVAPDRVLTTDPLMQSRFVQRWQVRVGEEVIGARPAAWSLDRSAMLLALERPAAASPLAFTPAAKEPLYTIHHGDEGNGWSTWVQPYQASGWLLQYGRRHRAITAGSLLVDGAGSPVAISMTERMPSGESWRQSYTAWPWIEQKDYEAALQKIRATAGSCFLRAELALRAVPVRPGEEERRWNRDESEQKLEQAQTAVILSPRRVLVLTALSPSQTARLETVRLRLADGTTLNASFVGSSEEYGALVVDPGRDLPAPVALAGTPWAELRDRMLFTADIRMTGEEHVIHCGHLRFSSLQPGYKNRPVPVFGGSKITTTFLFDSEGRLVGLPMAKRVKSKQSRWDNPDAFMVAAAEAARFAGETAGWADARNHPLTEAESRRLAWLGVDLQPLDAELALAHGVSTQTDNGGHGALVTHLYAGSPADKAGLKTGDVLLRVLPEGGVKPVNIEVERHAFSDQPFPWDRYDEINETYFDRIPAPWLPAENSLHRMLKDFGVGTAYRLDYARAGKVASLELKVEAGPLHFMTAPESVRDALGFRLRELTFETRRFYQLADDAPALIVARVEAGGAAAVAGLKPYELITTVNDQPVGTAEAFDRAMTAGGVLRIGVRRMNQSRVVVLDTAAAKPANPAPVSTP